MASSTEVTRHNKLHHSYADELDVALQTSCLLYLLLEYDYRYELVSVLSSEYFEEKMIHGRKLDWAYLQLRGIRILRHLLNFDYF